MNTQNPVTGTDDLVITRTFSAPRSRVFAAFADKSRFIRWWGPPGVSVDEAIWTATPGDDFRVVMRGQEGTYILVGRFIAVEPDHRLVFSWAWETDGVPGHESEVTLTFDDNGPQTRMTLVHSGLPDTDAVEKHTEGWAGCLDRLTAFLDT
ncbi:SRPBCC family protein [Eilatimonas milleporae]|uniref:Uncharacterized protein YndB with AHSA1/START domain n=1 Tax=Eilatimonas milleporae TaxID=911205 RepID=A0A3M0BYY2_9PROT|nr:SRPBCC domain-containing protein [Eilatimonas milleporae]RMB01795.1 uncharacterized protein YndB with AHSA1/START domain [Eilatimonas milleporae]